MCSWDFGVCGLGFRRVKGAGITLSQVLGSKSLDQNGLLYNRALWAPIRCCLGAWTLKVEGPAQLPHGFRLKIYRV